MNTFRSDSHRQSIYQIVNYSFAAESPSARGASDPVCAAETDAALRIELKDEIISWFLLLIVVVFFFGSPRILPFAHWVDKWRDVCVFLSMVLLCEFVCNFCSGFESFWRWFLWMDEVAVNLRNSGGDVSVSWIVLCMEDVGVDMECVVMAISVCGDGQKKMYFLCRIYIYI